MTGRSKPGQWTNMVVGVSLRVRQWVNQR